MQTRKKKQLRQKLAQHKAFLLKLRKGNKASTINKLRDASFDELDLLTHLIEAFSQGLLPISKKASKHLQHHPYTATLCSKICHKSSKHRNIKLRQLEKVGQLLPELLSVLF